MTPDDLQPITRIKNKDAVDLIKQGAKGEIRLYTVIKADVEVSYCYAELHVCPTTGHEQLSTHDPHIFKHYSRGDIIELPVEALDELWLNRKLKGHTVSKIFPAPPEDCKLDYPGTLPLIELDDVYLGSTSLPKSSVKKSPKNKAPHTRAIEAAFKALGKETTNEKIYAWIKRQSQSPSEEHKPFMNYLDFEDDDILDFSVTDQKSTILRSNDKPVSKQAFQDACSKARKKI